ncbi:MAG: hypothetical protein FRX48_04822 [Lasallia pustulata]|uniref:Uncharacterized protein n=1 Tax=Lasallia pustulata TaxID=136370 RepID=A0A5M8PR62_9LECA|nr:MAG: hypothetical protein FRX48_04822 [Lasallia pustulata]
MASKGKKPELLDLPPELRTKIWEQTLMPAGERLLNQLFEHKPPFARVANPYRGEVQGLSLWTIEPTFDTAIVRVSQGVNKEASSIVGKIEWVSVTVDVNGYSSRLESGGFIAPFAMTPFAMTPRAETPGKNFGEAGLEVDVKFGLNPPGKDKFFCSTLELPGLCRALSLTAGYSSAQLCLKMGKCGNASDDIRRSRESDIVGPFTNPIGQPGRVTVEGCMTEEILTWAKEVNKNRATSSTRVQQIISDLLARSDESIELESWHEAHDRALSCIGLIDIALKYDAIQHLYYTDIYNYLRRTNALCLSNMILASLKLNDATLAFTYVIQIKDNLVDLRGEVGLSTANMRIGMVHAKLGNNRDAMDYFSPAYHHPPQDPQVIEELQAFRQGMEENKDPTREEKELIMIIKVMLDGEWTPPKNSE